MVRFRRDLVFGALVLSCLAGAQAEPLLAKGQAALDEGRFAVALRLGTEAVAKSPKAWQAHRLVARAAVELDQADRAEKAYKEAIRFAPVSVRAGLQSELKGVATLREALAQMNRAHRHDAPDHYGWAAQLAEAAYRLMPKRHAYGLEASVLFEKAGQLEDARRMLDEVRGRTLPPAAAATVKERLEVVLTKIDAAREAARLEAQRKEEERLAAEKQRAEEAERKRIEAERKAEQERQKAERERQTKEETERLQRELSDYKAQLSNAESDLQRANSRVSDEERAVRDADSHTDRARSRRDSAKREVEDWKDKVESAKADVAKEVYRTGLRAAEAKYDDARDDYERANRRYEDAKSRLSDAEREVNDARRKLDAARQNVRETEDAIARLASGG